MSKQHTAWGGCKVCGYGILPKHVGPVNPIWRGCALRCERCGYTTETKPNWAEARAAWRAGSPDYAGAPL